MVLNKGIRYNNENPREENVDKYKYFPEMIKRAKSAHLNALEAFPFFAASVLIARVQKVDVKELTQLCARYLALRGLYTFLYIFGVNKFVGVMRTLCWVSSLRLMMKIATLGL